MTNERKGRKRERNEKIKEKEGKIWGKKGKEMTDERQEKGKE